MQEIMVKLRWYPGDSLTEIEEDDLSRVSDKYGVKISLEKVEGKRAVLAGAKPLEEVWGTPLEEMSQTVVTVSTDNEEALRKGIREIVTMYQSPVPSWGLYGSSRKGQDIAMEILEEDDGW